MNFRLRAAILIAAVFLVDRAAKIYIQDSFSLLDSVTVIPEFFNIVHSISSKGHSVVVDDFNVFHTLVCPNKTNAPLVVYANTVLAPAITNQCFRMIAGQRQKTHPA